MIYNFGLASYILLNSSRSTMSWTAKIALVAALGFAFDFFVVFLVVLALDFGSSIRLSASWSYSSSSSAIFLSYASFWIWIGYYLGRVSIFFSIVVAKWTG